MLSISRLATSLVATAYGLGVDAAMSALSIGIQVNPLILNPLQQMPGLGPVDKPVLAPARLGRCNTDVATGVTRRSADLTGKQRIKGRRDGFPKKS